MPRKPAVITPIAAPHAIKASLRAILDSPLWRQAEAPGGPLDLALGLFVQLRILRWTQGTSSPAVRLAKTAYNEQLTLTALLLYQDRRIQAHCASAEDLRRYLAGFFEPSIRTRPVAIALPPGTPLGSERGLYGPFSQAELLTEFPKVVDRLSKRYQRPAEHTRRPNWIKDIAKGLGSGVSERTVKNYLKRYPELQQCLDKAQGKNIGSPELPLGRANV